MEVKLCDLQKKIKLIETDIQMTLSNINDERVSTFAKKLLARDLAEKYFLLDKLRNLGNNTTEQEFGITWDDIDWSNIEQKYASNKERLENGVVSKICGCQIIEPVSKRMFLIHGLEKFKLTESDVVGYNDNTITKELQIICRDNINCPIVTTRNYLKYKDEGYEELLNTIKIETLDATGCVLYETVYTGLQLTNIGCISGDYRNIGVQEFELSITYHDFTISRVKTPVDKG